MYIRCLAKVFLVYCTSCIACKLFGSVVYLVITVRMLTDSGSALKDFQGAWQGSRIFMWLVVVGLCTVVLVFLSAWFMNDPICGYMI